MSLTRLNIREETPALGIAVASIQQTLRTEDTSQQFVEHAAKLASYSPATPQLGLETEGCWSEARLL